MDKIKSILEDFADFDRADPRQRRNAASACAILGGEDCVERLVRLAVSDPDNDVRKHASRKILNLPKEEWGHLEDSITSHFHDTQHESTGEGKDSGGHEEKLEQEVRKEKRELADVLGCLYHQGLEIPKISRGFFDRLRLAWYAHSSGMKAYVDKPRARMFKFSASTVILGAVLFFFITALAKFEWLQQTANEERWRVFARVMMISIGVIFLSGMRIAPNWKLRNRPGTWVLVDILKTAIIGGAGAAAILAILLEVEDLINGRWFFPSIVVTGSVVAATRLGTILAYDLRWPVVSRNFIVRGLIGGAAGLLLVFILIRFVPGNHDFFRLNLMAALLYSLGLGVVFSRVDRVGPKENSRRVSKLSEVFSIFTVVSCLIFIGFVLIPRHGSEISAVELALEGAGTAVSSVEESFPVNQRIEVDINSLDPDTKTKIPLTLKVALDTNDQKNSKFVVTIFQKDKDPKKSEEFPATWTMVEPDAEVSFKVSDRYNLITEELHQRLGGSAPAGEEEETRKVTIVLARPGPDEQGE